MTYDVFISYASADATSVDYVVQKLDLLEISYWLDRERLLAGDPLLKGLEDGLNASNAVLVCLGAGGFGHWQQSEIQIALQHAIERRSKKVILLILPTAPKNSLSDQGVPVYMQTFRYLDLRAGFDQDEVWEELFKSLKPGKQFPVMHSAKRTPSSSKVRIRHAVSIALIRDESVLLVRRALSQRTGAGLWQLPGGKIRSGEEPIAAVVRESLEEVGVPLAPVDIHEVTELTDVWLDRATGESMVMRLFWAPAPDSDFHFAPEFDDHVWVRIANLFNESHRVYFGATGQLLRIVRRYLYVHRPLSYLATILESNSEIGVALPQQLPGLSVNSTQVLYSLLSVLGFLEDRGVHGPASVVSSSLIKTLAAWALTQGQVFEPQGGDQWYRDAVRGGAKIELERYRAALFEEHESLLGLLSYRLSKALSRRTVCDIVILAVDPQRGHRYLLLRWDFLGKKYQIPAKGLELLEENGEAAPRFVVGSRLDRRLADAFHYENMGSLETAHVSAGSLDDGPLMRKYEILVYKLAPVPGAQHTIVAELESINAKTVATLTESPLLAYHARKEARFYVWCDLEQLLLDRGSVLGRKLQGFEEIIEHLGEAVVARCPTDLVISAEESRIPVIEQIAATHDDQLQLIMRGS